MLRERRINGPVILLLLSLLGWNVAVGVIAVSIAKRVAAKHHVHNVDCWDH